MPKPRPSVTKRQREQTKRDRQAAKVARREQRKIAGTSDPESQDSNDILEPPVESQE